MIETQMASSSGGSWLRYPKPAPETTTHQAHVLAVDDSLVDRKVIETLLKISSCKVTAVDSGRRALQFLGLDEEEEERSFSTDDDGCSKVDLIITDYCMPGMTGYELLKKIKESSAFREVPVVIMSSDNINTRINRCLEEGAEDYIVKPVKLSDVRRLKDYMMMREDRSDNVQESSRIGNKRKLRDGSDLSTSTAISSLPHNRSGLLLPSQSAVLLDSLARPPPPDAQPLLSSSSPESLPSSQSSQCDATIPTITSASSESS